METEQIVTPGDIQQSSSWRAVSARVIEAVIGAVLLAAGLIKAYQPLDFIQQITDYKIITAPTPVKLIAWVMIAVECALGAALIAGYRRRVAVPAAGALFLVFLATLGWAWYSGATADCGCFGSWVKRTPAQAFLEDALMLGAIGAARMLNRNEPARYRPWRLVVVAVAMITGLAVTAWATHSPRQSNDPLVRLRAQAQQESPFRDLKISDLAEDVRKGFYLVALIDTGCEHCQASVPALNNVYAQRESLPPLVALCSNEAGEVARFQQKFGARFPIGRISPADFTRLFERGKPPRIFLLRDGAVVKIWDGVVPPEAEIKSLHSR